jgi:hypothetical protein
VRTISTVQALLPAHVAQKELVLARILGVDREKPAKTVVKMAEKPM